MYIKIMSNMTTTLYGNYRCAHTRPTLRCVPRI